MSENNHPIHDLMETTMEKLHELVDTNSVVGQPIVTEDGVTLIPVSKLTFGFASGGSDFSGKNQQTPKNFGGGVGAGVSVTPMAFLVVKDGSAKLISASPANESTLGHVMDLVPDVVDKITAYIEKRNEKKKEDSGKKEAEEP